MPIFQEPRLGVPHISPSVGEMWELTEARVEISAAEQTFRHRPRHSFPSHISPKNGEIWGTPSRGY